MHLILEWSPYRGRCRPGKGNSVLFIRKSDPSWVGHDTLLNTTNGKNTLIKWVSDSLYHYSLVVLNLKEMMSSVDAESVLGITDYSQIKGLTEIHSYNHMQYEADVYVYAYVFVCKIVIGRWTLVLTFGSISDTFIVTCWLKETLFPVLSFIFHHMTPPAERLLFSQLLLVCSSASRRGEDASTQSQAGGDRRWFWVLWEKESGDCGLFSSRWDLQRLSVGDCSLGEARSGSGQKVLKFNDESNPKWIRQMDSDLLLSYEQV